MPTWPISSIKELIEPTLKHMGYELYSLEQSGQAGRTLRIPIDHAEPITGEDCERVRRVAGPLIEKGGRTEGAENLEAHAPGRHGPRGAEAATGGADGRAAKPGSPASACGAARARGAACNSRNAAITWSTASRTHSLKSGATWSWRLRAV